MHLVSIQSLNKIYSAIYLVGGAILVALAAVVSPANSYGIPVAGRNVSLPPAAPEIVAVEVDAPELVAPPVESKFDAFYADLPFTNTDEIIAVYSDDGIALDVFQQPANTPGYIEPRLGTATEFEYASRFNNIGILAHNYLSGYDFFQLEHGSVVTVVYGNGKTAKYEVTTIKQYQALSPDSLYSDFIDLYSGKQLTSSQLFAEVYTGDHHLTLQTCIAQGNEDSWGRHFVIATPLN